MTAAAAKDLLVTAIAVLRMQVIAAPLVQECWLVSRDISHRAGDVVRCAHGAGFLASLISDLAALVQLDPRLELLPFPTSSSIETAEDNSLLITVRATARYKTATR